MQTFISANESLAYTASEAAQHMKEHKAERFIAAYALLFSSHIISKSCRNAISQYIFDLGPIMDFDLKMELHPKKMDFDPKNGRSKSIFRSFDYGLIFLFCSKN